MHKPGTLTFIAIFSIAILISCNKNPASNPPPIPTNIVGNFSAQIKDRQWAQTLISWTKPTFPSGTSLNYRLYISSYLVAQTLTDTSYVLTGLSPTLSYTGRVVAYINAADSSYADFTIPVYTGPGPDDSTFVLSRVTDAGGLNLKFDYDEINKRLNSWAATYTTYYDSTKVLYDASGKVLSIVRKSSSYTSPFGVVPNVFEYNSQGLVSKVYHKQAYSTNESYAYMTTVTFPLDFLYEIASYDSINYDALKRVSSVYNFAHYNSNPTTTGYYTSYRNIYYSPANDSLVSRVDIYTRNNSNPAIFDLSTLNFNTYNNRVNPYYSLFRKIYQEGVQNSRTNPTFLPYYYYAYTLNDYLMANPYICTDINSSMLNYTYNAEGLVTRCIKGADNFEWVNFEYKRVKK